MVYLTIKGGKILYHTDIEEMRKAGITNPGIEMEDEEFKALGGYAKIVNGKIVVGMTAEEKAEENRQAKKAEYMTLLDGIDKEALSGRPTRDLLIALSEKNGLTETDAYDKLSEFEARAEEIRKKLKPLLG